MPTFQPTPPVHPVRRKLAAGPDGVTVIEVPGTSFRVTEATGALSLKIDDGGSFPFALGMAFTCPPGTGFQKIELANLSAEENTVEILITAGTITDDRLNIIDGRFPISTVDQPSFATGSGIITLAAGSSVTLDGVPPAGAKTRKSVMLTNFDLANPLIVEDAAGVAVGACLPRTAWRENISGAVRVSNPSGGGISCIYGEVWNAR